MGYRAILAVLGMLGASAAEATERYLCISDKSTGFRWNGSQWDITRFKVDGERYLVSQTTSFVPEKDTFDIKLFGTTEARYRCERYKLDGAPQRIIQCGSAGWGMLVDTTSMRFIEFSSGDFVYDDKKSTPSTTIGTCTKLE